jgi:hypothetical protein
MGADYSKLVTAYTRLAKNVQEIQMKPASQVDLDAVTSQLEAASAKILAVLQKQK